MNPWALISFQKGQLSAQSSDLLSNLIVSASERAPLKQCCKETQCAYASDYPSGPTKTARMFRKIDFVFGVVIILFGWFLLGMSLELFYKAHALRWYIAPAIGLIGFFLMGHGLFLAATGNGLLASLNRRSENIVVQAIIVPELELCNVKMQVFLADVVECADDAALEDAPEAFNRVSVHCTDNVLPLRVVDGDVRIALTETMVPNPLIGAEQANLVRYGFIDKGLKRGSANVLNDPCDYVTFAADSASNDSLARTSWAGNAVAFVGMTVLGLATNERLIDLDNAAKFGFGLDQSSADFVSHQPCGFDRTKTHVATKLACAHALFAGQDQMSDLEPVAKGLVGVFEDGPGDAGEAVAVYGTRAALPMKAFIGRCIVKVGIAATRTIDAIRPAPRDQISLASLIVVNRKHGVELGRSELMDGFGALNFGHGKSSFVGGYNHAG
jgi:hypothetical protein